MKVLTDKVFLMQNYNTGTLRKNSSMLYVGSPNDNAQGLQNAGVFAVDTNARQQTWNATATNNTNFKIGLVSVAGWCDATRVCD